ncbi:hypothetical protein RDI58_022797 [Solanum bulbocastanum]|uniref:Uncharacterized protein n=1 Tax=Solanum bulbocastanum TaxID=147425 RepID=A0AAN8Y8L5_SOLBU
MASSRKGFRSLQELRIRETGGTYQRIKGNRKEGMYASTFIALHEIHNVD